MDESLPSNVISLIDIGLNADEYYVQFVPPATFGVIFNRATTEVLLVLSNGEKSALRRTAEKIYTLRGFIALRRREQRELELGGEVEDDIIRHILVSFGSLEKLREGVRKFCPLRENSQVIAQVWALSVFPEEGEGNFILHILWHHTDAAETFMEGDERRAAGNENSGYSSSSVYDPALQPSTMDEVSPNLEVRTPFSDTSAFSGGEQIAINDIHPVSVTQTLSSTAQSYPILSLQELEEYTLPVPFDHSHTTSDHFIYTAEVPVDGNPLRVNLAHTRDTIC